MGRIIVLPQIIAADSRNYPREQATNLNPAALDFLEKLNEAVSNITIPGDEIVTLTGERNENRLDIRASSNKTEVAIWSNDEFTYPTALVNDDRDSYGDTLRELIDIIDTIAGKEVEFLWEGGNAPYWFNVVSWSGEEEVGSIAQDMDENLY